MSAGQVGVQVQRPVRVRQGLLQVAQGVMRRCAVVPDFGLVRVEREGSVVLCNGCCQVAAGIASHAAPVVLGRFFPHAEGCQGIE